jgi:hypothetical protein
VELKTVLFFRAEKKFETPDKKQFPFFVDRILTVDVGDTLEEIDGNLERIRKTIRSLEAGEIYVCAAAPLGFIWILCTEVLWEFDEKKFHFLQMARGPESAGKKMYQVWR